MSLAKNKSAPFGQAASFLIETLIDTQIEGFSLFPLTRTYIGAGFANTFHWLKENEQKLNPKVMVKVSTIDTDAIVQWIKTGDGKRAAMLRVGGRHFRKQLGKTMSDTGPETNGALVLLKGKRKKSLAFDSPHTGIDGGEKLPDWVPNAHHQQRLRSLLFYAPGYS